MTRHAEFERWLESRPGNPGVEVLIRLTEGKVEVYSHSFVDVIVVSDGEIPGRWKEVDWPNCPWGESGLRLAAPIVDGRVVDDVNLDGHEVAIRDFTGRKANELLGGLSAALELEGYGRVQ